MPHTVVLIRHGESAWNKENRFTGFTDVDLTDEGRYQAIRAGNILRAHGYTFDVAFTSLLTRANRTLWHVLDEMNLIWIPTHKTWRLNERHYGALQGLNKAETAKKFGDHQVKLWRRSYDVQPPLLELDDPRHPRFDKRYKDVPLAELPPTESLKDCVARTLPYWFNNIVPAIQGDKRIVIAAHGNSLRGIVKHLDSISDEGIVSKEIPVGIPLVYLLDDNLKPEGSFYLGAPPTPAADVPVNTLPYMSFGLLGSPSAELVAWLNRLMHVGLTQPSYIHQECKHPPLGEAKAEPALGAPAGPTQPVTHLPAGITCHNSLDSLLDQCQYVVVDVSQAQDQRHALVEMLQHVVGKLQPDKHVLLALLDTFEVLQSVTSGLAPKSKLVAVRINLYLHKAAGGGPANATAATARPAATAPAPPDKAEGGGAASRAKADEPDAAEAKEVGQHGMQPHGTQHPHANTAYGSGACGGADTSHATGSTPVEVVPAAAATKYDAEIVALAFEHAGHRAVVMEPMAATAEAGK